LIPDAPEPRAITSDSSGSTPGLRLEALRRTDTLEAQGVAGFTSRRWLFRGLWLLFVLLPLSLLLGELSLSLDWLRTKRVAGGFTATNPFEVTDLQEATGKSLWKRRWVSYEPGAHLEAKIGSEVYVVSINSLGFRTHEFAERKPPGTIRVLCVGGSTTVQGPTNEETYPAILERALRAAFPSHPLEVLNLGISGSCSDRWLAHPETLFRFSPDIVVEYDGINDVMWRALPGYATAHPIQKVFHRSLLASRVFPVDPRGLDEGLSAAVANQMKLAALCRAHGAAHLSGSFAYPDFDEAPAVEQAFLEKNLAEWTSDPRTLSLRRYKEFARIMERYNELLDGAVRSGRLEGVDVQRALHDPSLFIDICHMNSEGISRLAQTFEAKVKEAIEARLSAADRGARLRTK
jgi:hypothetical protein